MRNPTGDRCEPVPPVGCDGRPVTFDPAWRTETVRALACGIDDGGKFDRMPILADALEESGCDRSEVLDHCRVCDHHHPNCWVIGLILDRPVAPPPIPEAERVAALQERVREASERVRKAPHGRRPLPVEGVPRAAAVALVLVTIAAAYLVAFGGLSTTRLPSLGDVTGPLVPNAIADVTGWGRVRGRLDESMRRSTEILRNNRPNGRPPALARP